jgi:hypothetical protein
MTARHRTSSVPAMSCSHVITDTGEMFYIRNTIYVCECFRVVCVWFVCGVKVYLLSGVFFFSFFSVLLVFLKTRGATFRKSGFYLVMTHCTKTPCA